MPRCVLFLLLLLAPAAARAQERTFVVDSVAVTGNTRLTPSQVIGMAGVTAGQSINYRDVQRTITTLFQTGQFDDVAVRQSSVGGKMVLAIDVKERPLMDRWAIRGVEKLSEGAGPHQSHG
jgi:outer membrane protein insertion porin family